ncbi:hypothetical protein [Symbiopectobacterium sp. RP]
MITANALICGKKAYLAVIKIMSVGYNRLCRYQKDGWRKQKAAIPQE